MRVEFIKRYYCCPACTHDLGVMEGGSYSEDQEILFNGVLVCSYCARTYRVDKEIPFMIPSDLLDLHAVDVDGSAWEGVRPQ